MKNLNTKETRGDFMNNWIEIVLRAIALFFLSLIIIRIIGKRNPLKLTPFSFITYVVIGVMAALISLDIVHNVAFGVIALLVWFSLYVLLDYASLKSKTLHDLFYGRESILIKDGKVMEENLAKERLSGEELLRALRSKNVFNLADVEFAIMETSGDINLFLKPDKTPLTPHDLERKVSPKSVPETVILDGNIMYESLSNLGLNERWLKTELQKLGFELNNVFIGQVDSNGQLVVDLFDDSITLPKANVKEMLYANIEKCSADLMTYALETKNEEARAMYDKNAKKLNNIMDRLRPYLLR
jgi:uncharacterized membrane protein YcaP (DUF421 family)